MPVARKTEPLMASQDTEYRLDGADVNHLRKRGRPKNIRNPAYFAQETKVECAALYCVTGDLKDISKRVHVPIETLRIWQQEAWWAEIQRRIMVDCNDKLLSTINSTLDKALTALVDRLENGDVVKQIPNVDEEGNVVMQDIRSPVKARDLSQIFNALSHQRQLMLGSPTQITAQTSTDARLQHLQERFEQFSKAKTIEGEVKQIEDK